jgi:hypothetical protein
MEDPLRKWLIPHKPATVVTLRNFFEAKHLLIKIVDDQSNNQLQKSSKVIDVMSSNKLFIQKRAGKRNTIYGLISGIFNQYYIEV